MKIAYSKKQIDMMRKFIDAGYQITQESGYDALSVRSVAAKTNYNKASLYYYFPNFEYYRLFVSLRYLNGFFNDLHQIENRYINSLDLYIKTFKALIHHIIKHPNQFDLILFTDMPCPLEETFDIYYHIYPSSHIWKDVKFPIYMSSGNMIIPLLDICIAHGHIKSKSRNKITELTESILNTLILKAKTLESGAEAPQLEERFTEYICLFLEFYKTPIGILNLKDI